MNIGFDSNTVKWAVVTFVTAFLAIEPVANLIGIASGSQPVDVSTLRAAGVAGVAAVLTGLYHFFFEPTVTA